MQNDELLPCPRCGGKAFVTIQFGVMCEVDRCLHLPPRSNREEAIAAWNTRAAPSGEGRTAGEDRLRETCINVAAHLAAAISLLEKGGSAAKKAAPSDKMFDQMIRDYKRSLSKARAALAQPKGGDHG